MIEIEEKFLKPAIEIAQEIIGDAGKIFKVKDGDLKDLEFCLAMMTDADKHAWQVRMATINLEVARKEREIEDAIVTTVQLNNQQWQVGLLRYEYAEIVDFNKKGGLQ